MDPQSPEDLGKVRGWLILMVVVLIPHGVGGVMALFSPEFRAAAQIGSSGLALLVFTVVGNLAGILLIVTRSRVAPVFFTLYLPILFGSIFLERNLLTSVNARLAALGSTGRLSEMQLVALLAANAVIGVLMVGYWVRSKRVRAVFGTTGLDLLRLGEKRSDAG
jgi:hypothetical protein